MMYMSCMYLKTSMNQSIIIFTTPPTQLGSLSNKYAIPFSDITIPGSNTSSDSGPSKIPAGETVLVIKTPRGVYIRTPQGKIFAVRAGTKGLGGESTAVGASGTSAASLLTSNTITTKSGDAQGGLHALLRK